MSLHLWMIPLLPLLGAVLNGVAGRRLPKKLVTTIALTVVAASFVLCVWVGAHVNSTPLQLPYLESHGAWIEAGGFKVDFGFYLDQLTLVMILIVTGVGLLIHLYSVGYMAEEGGFYRYFAYLNLFMFFMLVLVLAGNYLLMFVGWEGVGLASYLLIGFNFSKNSAASAGKKAFIVNRVGDAGFILGLFLLIKTFGSLDFQRIMSATASASVEAGGAGVLTAIALLLLIGATGKSAQIPLYVWLPDAMEGPTPVSALIHAATMVTAGVYMIARSNPIFARAPYAMLAVATIGCITAFFAATIATVQTDIKKVLAYSTISQLGYMFLACGVAAYSAATFHLMTHAFFKALLFLAAGSVIHALGGEQDMRNMGGLRSKIPWTFFAMTVGTLAIAGTPLFSGFFSKDEILWRTWASGRHLYWGLALLTALLTSFYMFRMWFNIFLGSPRSSESDVHSTSVDPGSHSGSPSHHVHESPRIMLAPLVVLAVLSIVGGYVGVPRALGGRNRFEEFLAPVFQGAANAAGAKRQTLAEQPAATSSDESGMERMLTGASVGVAILGFLLAWTFYYRRRDLPDKFATRFSSLYQSVVHKYYVDEAYNAALVQPLLEGARVILWRGIDVGLIDASVNRAGRDAMNVSASVRKMQSGNIRSYAGWIVGGAALVVAFMLWVEAG